MKRITLSLLIDAAQEVVTTVRQYKLREFRGERKTDAVMLGYLQGRFGGIQRQHNTSIGSGGGVSRIDFRQGGTCPVLIEFAVCTSKRGCIYGGPNRKELIKLERFPPSKAKARYLILLDITKQEPIHKKNLHASYKRIKGGRGCYARHSVRVIYVHEDSAYSFIWKPYK